MGYCGEKMTHRIQSQTFHLGQSHGLNEKKKHETNKHKFLQNIKLGLHYVPNTQTFVRFYM